MKHTSQEEERAAFERSQQAAGGQVQQAFLARLQAGLATVAKHKDPLLQALAVSCLPLSILERLPPTPEGEEAVAKALLKWFKHDFFKWVRASPIELQPACYTPELRLRAGGQPHMQQLRQQDALCKRQSPRYARGGGGWGTRRGGSQLWHVRPAHKISTAQQCGEVADHQNGQVDPGAQTHALVVRQSYIFLQVWRMGQHIHALLPRRWTGCAICPGLHRPCVDRMLAPQPNAVGAHGCL